MYEQFFNFESKPFDLLPNPDMLFMSKTHGKALSYLRYGIQERAGFILLTGDVGAGKTTLIRELIKNHLERVTLAKVFNTRADSQLLLTMINDDFGLETEGRSKAALLRELNEFLIDQYAMGQRSVLIIDEAQNLSEDLLEEVRMLSNLETDGGKLLQIILVGQPELRETLGSPGLLQLRQRIQIGCHLTPLNKSEVRDYILYRMECAGNRDALVFSDEAVDMIHKVSRGVPRLINILCDYVLIDACANESRAVSKVEVSEIIDELDFERQYWPEQKPLSRRPPARSKVQPNPRKAEVVLKTIKDLESRLASMEQGYCRSTPFETVDLLDRLERIEKQMGHQKQQLESLKTMYWNQAAASRMESVSKFGNGKDNEPRRSWAYRLLFGGE